jgi:branched-chain amino acid transport system substrate-binding protein
MKRLKTKRIHAKLVAFLLCLAMVSMLTACGGSNNAGTGTSSSSGNEEITIGWVMPFTGALAEWTNTVKYVAERALKIINDDNGGIYIKEYDKKVPIKIIWADSQSDSTKASDVAKKLVLDDKVDFLIGGVTPDTINPVSAVAETNDMPALMVSAPDSPWLEGGPYNWT